MKARDAIIAWTPPTGAYGPGIPKRERFSGRVRVGEFPCRARDWTAPYLMTGGAVETRWRHGSVEFQKILLFVLFATMVVRDGMDPAAVHAEFLKIDEYRDTMPEDTPGVLTAPP